MTAIITPREGPPPPNSAKSGEHYDRCPADGCIEVDSIAKNGGVDPKSREEHLNWSMFHANRKQGGCGFSWARNTKQGAEKDKDKYRPKWLSRSAERDATMSVPSPLYQERYDLIDWSK